MRSWAKRKSEELRDLYFKEAEIHAPDRGDRLLIDKQPLAMGEAPVILRLFPRTRFLFVERHPCDVVLSNFMARFEPNDALANFVSIEGAARLYDRLIALWARSRELLDLKVDEVRYERLIAGPESEMEAVIAFLGLPWSDAISTTAARLEAVGSSTRRATRKWSSPSTTAGSAAGNATVSR